eukprot:5905712-Pyramimonas_sp.AAC.1
MLTLKLHIQISGYIYIVNVVGDKKRSSFQWVPAHLNHNLENALLSGYPFGFYLGSEWSDWFAKR